jgi:hypothetical protein
MNRGTMGFVPARLGGVVGGPDGGGINFNVKFTIKSLRQAEKPVHNQHRVSPNL